MSSSLYAGRGGNPYRSGVLIGNYVEDMFGLDLKQKYGKLSTSYNNLSEHRDQFRWPIYTKEQLTSPGNDLTMSCTMNYDLNIDFKKNSTKDYENFGKIPTSTLDKNAFLPDEIKMQSYLKQLEDEKNCTVAKENVEDITNNTLRRLNANDAGTILFTKKTGLSGNLLFGHGEQNKFDRNDLASVYDLSHNQRIPTKDFLDNNYELKSSFKMAPPPDKDYYDWGFRKYREYGRFTKKFDKKKKK